MKPNTWDFAGLQFATDASLHGAETTWRMFEFSEDIVCAAKDITGLELYTVIVAVNFWAPHFEDVIFFYFGRQWSCCGCHKFLITLISSWNFVYVNCGSRLSFMISNWELPGVHNVLADPLS